MVTLLGVKMLGFRQPFAWEAVRNSAFCSGFYCFRHEFVKYSRGFSNE